jgi:hypothetical protein
MPFIKEGVINIFLEHHGCDNPSMQRGKKSKLFIQTVDLPYEGEGEKGTNP